jgi:hypothetical protein
MTQRKFAHRRSITQEGREAILKAETMIDPNSKTWVDDYLKAIKIVEEEEAK